MSIANQIFLLIFICLRHPLYIRKPNLKEAMDKEDCRNSRYVLVLIMLLASNSDFFDLISFPKDIKSSI